MKVNAGEVSPQLTKYSVSLAVSPPPRNDLHIAHRELRFPNCELGSAFEYQSPYFKSNSS